MKSGKTLKIFAALVFLAFSVASGFFLVFLHLERPADPDAESILFTVNRGSSVISIMSSLEDKGLVRSSFVATMLTRLHNYSIKAGTYRISPQDDTKSIVAQLHAGKQESIRVTIPEGLTISKTARYFAEAGLVSQEEFLLASRDSVILERFGIPASSAEGFLFPDTYEFHYGATGEEIMAAMISNFFKKTTDMAILPQDLNELFKVVILASIVEREYRVAREAPLIASVFSNRLKIGMGLQSCSTVEYIITEVQGKPHPARLLTADLEIPSDYNTYLWAGLPPGPISNPGKTALEAAANPPRTQYLYFRLTDPVRGTHVFTRSLDEHVDAGRQLYLKRAADN